MAGNFIDSVVPNLSAPAGTNTVLQGPMSSTTALSPTTPPTNAFKSTISGTTGTASSNTVQPVGGLPNETPPSGPDPSAWAIDTYRNGGGSDSNNDTVNKYALSTNGSTDSVDIASMSLNIVGAGNGPASTIISSYSRFFLQSVVEAEQEKYQIVETFTGYYAFFFGKRPPIYRYSGLLLCDDIYRWNNDFKFVYENYFRGTRAAEFESEVTLLYDGRQVTGFPLSLNMQQEAMSDKGIPFSMDVLVVSHTPLNFSVDIASLIASAEQQLTNIKKNIQSYIASLGYGTGSQKSTLIAGNAMNGTTPAVSATTVQSATSSLSSVPFGIAQ